MIRPLAATVLFLVLTAPAAAGWYRIGRVRKPTGTDTLADVDSHVHRRSRDADVVGRVHYGVHYINEELRQGRDGNAAYCLAGWAYMMPEPPATLRRVGRACRYRGPVYGLYVGAREWNRQPLYLADEWSAYVAGACQAVEMGDMVRARHSFGCAAELLYYMTVLRGVLPAGYNAEEYDRLWWFAVRRTRGMYECGARGGWASLDQYRWLERVGELSRRKGR